MIIFMNDRFSELLSQMIASHGMTPEGLANNLDIPVDEMLSYVKGEKCPDYKLTSDIVHALGMTMEDFNRMYNGDKQISHRYAASPEMDEFFENKDTKGQTDRCSCDHNRASCGFI